MSAWPEAVWIVRKLQANFDFEEEINNYTIRLNSLNEKVNNLNDRVANDQLSAQATRTELLNRVVTIRAKKASSGNVPDTSQSYSKGAIWIVIP